MRKKDKQIHDKSTINEILKSAHVCRIGFSVDNQPYIVPVNYGYANNRIFVHSAPEGRKIESIKRNNNICFEIEMDSQVIGNEIPCSWTTKYRSIIGYGRISIITDKSEKIEALNVIMGKYGFTGEHNYQKKSLERVVILKIDIEEVTAKQSGIW